MFFPLIFGATLEEATAFGWATNTAPYLFLRAFDISSGIGAGLTGASPNVAGDGNGIAFSPTGGAVGFAQTGSPKLTAYPFSAVTGITGAAYSTPATPPDGTGNDVSFSPDGNYISCSTTVAPYIWVYPWTDSAGFGTKIASPATEPPNTANKSRFNDSSNELSVAHFTSPFVTVYPWTGAFGTKYSNPASGPGANAFSCSWSPDDDALAVGATIPVAYDWTVGVGFGARYIDAVSDPDTGVRGIMFSPTGAGIGAASISSGVFVLHGWAWTHGSGWGSKFANPDANQTSNAWECNFTPSARAVVFSVNADAGALYPQMYAWTDAGGFGSRYANTSPGISGLGFDVSFNGRV